MRPVDPAKRQRTDGVDGVGVPWWEPCTAGQAAESEFRSEGAGPH